jgi:hypothetical protein
MLNIPLKRLPLSCFFILGSKNAQSLITTASRKCCEYELNLAKIFKDLLCQPNFLDPLIDVYANFVMGLRFA